MEDFDDVKLLLNELEKNVNEHKEGNENLIENITGQLINHLSGMSPKDQSENLKNAQFYTCSLLTNQLKLTSCADHQLGKDEVTSDQMKNKTINQLNANFQSNKHHIQNHLGKSGNSHNIPVLSNCTWQLAMNFNVKSSKDLSDLEYKIAFQTFDRQYGKIQNDTEFICSPEEIQYLINKLKDIERHCEKIEMK